MTSFWISCQGQQLEQGDYLPGCWIPLVGADFFVEASAGRNTLVVDFRQIFSLPVPYLHKHAIGLGSRWRLQSPYREHFSQACARFFMRVGLPTAIPAFK